MAFVEMVSGWYALEIVLYGAWSHRPAYPRHPHALSVQAVYQIILDRPDSSDCKHEKLTKFLNVITKDDQEENLGNTTDTFE